MSDPAHAFFATHAQVAHAPRHGSTERRDVTTKGARVCFHLTAPVTATGTRAPSVLLLHDFLETHGVWSPVVEILAGGARILVPDLPGFGASEKPSPRRFRYDPASLAEVVVDAWAALGKGPVAVAGTGLGAAVAVAMAATHPHVVQRVALVGRGAVGALLGPRPSTLVAALRAPVLGPLLVKQVSGERLVRWSLGPRGSDGALRGRRLDAAGDAMNTPAAREAASAVLSGLADGRALLASLPRIHVPTLLMVGRDDGAPTLAEARKLARQMPDARVETLPGGAAPVDHDPHGLARALAAFFGIAALATPTPMLTAGGPRPISGTMPRGRPHP